MKTETRLAGLVLAAVALSGCVEDTGSGSSGLSGTQSQFDSMTAPCIAQASRLTGFPQSSISVIDRIQTGGGPLLVLNANGQRWSCRLEDNGTVTVFSEFAN